jgi:hypothetical protein
MEIFSNVAGIDLPAADMAGRTTGNKAISRAIPEKIPGYIYGRLIMTGTFVKLDAI